MNNKEELFYRFIRGESIQEIANDIGLTWSQTYQIIGAQLPVSKDFSDEEKDMIKQMYLSGISTTKIGERFKVSHKLIGEILNGFGIKRIHNGVRKYTLNEKYFDSIDTPNKSYILGFLYADGYNDMNKKTIRLQLTEKDKDILERINKEIESNKPLKLVDCSKRVYGNGYVSKNMYTLEFYGKHICEALDKDGVHQSKSLILQYPGFLQDGLHKHFIRGYFDGDGSIYRYQTKRGNFQSNITITSTEQFCETCLQVIRDNTSIGGNIYDASNHNGITKVLSISGNNQCKEFLDWLYTDAELYLKRKYDRYLQYYYSKAA